jgi:hypothetical protein
MAALVAAYTIARYSVHDTLITIEPPPAASSSGRALWMVKNVPVQCHRRCGRSPALGDLGNPLEDSQPGVGEHSVQTSVAFADPGDQPVEISEAAGARADHEEPGASVGGLSQVFGGAGKAGASRPDGPRVTPRLRLCR